MRALWLVSSLLLYYLFPNHSPLYIYIRVYNVKNPRALTLSHLPILYPLFSLCFLSKQSVAKSNGGDRQTRSILLYHNIRVDDQLTTQISCAFASRSVRLESYKLDFLFSSTFILACIYMHLIYIYKEREMCFSCFCVHFCFRHFDTHCRKLCSFCFLVAKSTFYYLFSTSFDCVS